MPIIVYCKRVDQFLELAKLNWRILSVNDCAWVRFLRRIVKRKCMTCTVHSFFHAHRKSNTCLSAWNKLPPALRQISDPSYELTQTSPLAISPHLFHSKLKTLLLIHRLPHTSL